MIYRWRERERGRREEGKEEGGRRNPIPRDGNKGQFVDYRAKQSVVNRIASNMRLVCWRSCRCRRHRPWTIYSIAKVTTKLPGKKKRSVNNKRLRVAPCGCWPRNRVNNEHPPGTPRPLLNVNNVISTERVNVVTFWQAVNGNVNGRRVPCIVLRKLQAFVFFSERKVKRIRTKIYS